MAGATVPGYTFTMNEQVTAAKLTSLATGTVTGIVNADISTDAAIVDTKLAAISTASKVSGAAITLLTSLPSGAGVIPLANLLTTSWTDYSSTSTVTGWASTENGKSIYYKKIGNIIFVSFYIDGTSNATTISFTLPVAQVSTMSYSGGSLIGSTDNGVALTVAARCVLIAGATTVNCYSNMETGAWTNVNRKNVLGTFWYESA